MKKFLKTAVFLILAAMIVNISSVFASDDTDNTMVSVGLYYGSSALPTANLENHQNQGYSFGFYDANDYFVTIGSTTHTQISVLKTQNIYLKDRLYYDSDPGNEDAIIGCYHLQLSESYNSFTDAQSVAKQIPDAFPAWIDGDYFVRIGAYEDRTAAENAQSQLDQETAIVGTSSKGLIITKTKTAEILLQFDGNGNKMLAISPGLDKNPKPITWFKGYRYYGTFLYDRGSTGNITVCNYLPIDDYLKGVLPYEMSPSWPLEALKAQAICARTYTVASCTSKHKSEPFDLCNSTCCQVYRGLNLASEQTNRAVDETSGVYAWYHDKLIETYYYSCNGGASESVNNVWSSTANMPYLASVVDPYEATVANKISGYYWTKNFTKSDLTNRLRNRGYDCGTIVDLRVLEYTEAGNVFSIAFEDDKGNTYPFTRERARTVLNLDSMRFHIDNGSDNQYYIDNGNDTISDISETYIIGEDGEVVSITQGDVYTITASETERLTKNAGTKGIFTVTGSGKGHHVGMSQWGAYAMDQQGFTYDEILKFYFTGIDLY